MRRGTPRRGGLNVTLECDGVRVESGDLIFGDESGVVVVPAEIVPEVVRAAMEIKRRNHPSRRNLPRDSPFLRFLD